MPIYEFRCSDCNKVSEILCLNSEKQTFLCPDCGSSNMERLVSSSYLMKAGSRVPGGTCCGREECCEAPPCSIDGGCRRH